MRCRHCKRGLTYHRASKEPPVMVFRRMRELAYCGHCFLLDRHEHQDGDEYYLLLGDSPSVDRVERLYLLVDRAAS